MIVTELLAKFGLQTDKASFARADATLEGLVGKSQQFVRNFARLSVVTGVGLWFRKMEQIGSLLDDTANRIGVTTKAIQELAYAGDQMAGVTQAEVTTALRFLSKTAYDAAQGLKEPLEAYKQLGITVKDEEGNLKSADRLFREVAEGMSKLDNESLKTGVSMKILGRSGQSLLPLFADGAAGLDKWAKEFEELGGGFSPEMIKAGAELGDQLARLRLQSQSLQSAIGGILIPMLNRGIQTLIDWGQELSKIFKGSKLLEIALIGLAGVAAIAGIRALIPWLPFLFTFLAIATAVTTVITLIDDIHSLLTGGKSLIGKYLDEWLGIGTVDRLVRQWSNGLDTLIDMFRGVGKWAWGTARQLKAIFTGDWEAAAKLTLDLDQAALKGFKSLAEDTMQAVKALGQTFSGTDELAPATAGRGIVAPLAANPHTPRAGGRGIGAALSPGSAGFGQAAQDSVHSLLRNPAVQTPASSPSVHQENNVTVQVNARTGADPKEIGREAEKATRKVLAEQNRNVRKALVNRPQD